MAEQEEPLRIDKGKTALVVIDLQKGVVGRTTAPTSPGDVIASASRMADAFRKKGLPVFLVRVMSTDAERLKPAADQQPPPGVGQLPKDFAEIVPELGPKEGDVVVTKKQWGAFYGTELDLQLRRRGLDTIVLCGISTNIGVESTARFAYEYGYQEIFASDAMAAMSAEEHRMSIERIFRRIGRVRTTEQIIRALD